MAVQSMYGSLVSLYIYQSVYSGYNRKEAAKVKGFRTVDRFKKGTDYICLH